MFGLHFPFNLALFLNILPLLNVFVLLNFSSIISFFLFLYFFPFIWVSPFIIIISGDVSRRMPNNFLSFSIICSNFPEPMWIWITISNTETCVHFSFLKINISAKLVRRKKTIFTIMCQDDNNDNNDQFNWANILPFFIPSSTMNHEQWALSYTINEYVYVFCYQNAGLIFFFFFGSADRFFLCPTSQNLGTNFSFISTDFIYSVSPPFLIHTHRPILIQIFFFLFCVIWCAEPKSWNSKWSESMKSHNTTRKTFRSNIH